MHGNRGFDPSKKFDKNVFKRILKYMKKYKYKYFYHKIPKSQIFRPQIKKGETSLSLNYGLI